uniref:Mitochondrial import inner membrane translocase subunit TIM50 n=1 Tax=Knipowitschia caucasica TaxID=637954 RepID=A0AAV2MMZ2_KNICA
MWRMRLWRMRLWRRCCGGGGCGGGGCGGGAVEEVLWRRLCGGEGVEEVWRRCGGGVEEEETLVYSSLSVIPDAEYSFTTVFQDHQYQVYMVLRPHVKEFLQAVSRNYELFVFTCSKRVYAEKVLDVLDPHKKLFRHRLYQEDCSCVLGHYIKDLRVLGRDLRTTVVLDNSLHTHTPTI